ncbi:uncharacterized protein B0H64DRAFT_386900 [Chaetomium fimeti]|uniref:Uncharacterized protein n=1 Tax=Chaetomium fimeti TaxID=1854472 RepID=A0AAE0LVB7_9PEZI|nr:hypothetical protein B0H64DRAFT_386900 [Chaetomium fimeti]
MSYPHRIYTMNKPETEILVHIAAPARASDDVNYRTLAAAYLDFEPVAHKSIVFGPSAEDEGVGRLGVDNTHKALPQTKAASHSASFGFIQSPMLSFQSVTHNFGSPGLQQPETKDVVESQSSWVAPPSIVEDSMPENDSVFARYCTPTRLLAHYTSTMDSSSPVSERKQLQTLPVSSPSRRKSPDPDQETSAEHNNIQHQTPHVNLGTVIPLSPGGDQKRRRPPTPTTSGIIEETRIASSYPSQPTNASSSFRADSEPPPPKRPRTSRDPSPGKPLARSASDVGPQPSTTTTTPCLPPDSPLSIHSPPPLTSHRTLHPDDMITDVLASLARSLNLAKRFQPASQTRPLRPFERGYWLVDCSGWDAGLKRSAWAFLADYLGKGAAGWGTSCTRDAGFSWLRVYCWGGVVGHMYLVLYLMSKRRVLYTGAEWVGAEGRAVVVMGVRTPPPPPPVGGVCEGD